MSIAHEKELHINENGVYPVVKKLPSPLCCFKVMHIRTGTLWIAYWEIMWIVSQCSFWTAESIVRQAFPPYVIIAGFTFTCIQLVLVFFLIQGVRTFGLAYMEVYMIGVCCRMFMFLSFFLTLLFFFIIADDNDEENSDQFFHRFLIIKMIFTCVYTLLKAYALYTAYRCYSYIAKTRRAIVHLTIFEDPGRCFSAEMCDCGYMNEAEIVTEDHIPQNIAQKLHTVMNETLATPGIFGSHQKVYMTIMSTGFEIKIRRTTTKVEFGKLVVVYLHGAADVLGIGFYHNNSKERMKFTILKMNSTEEKKGIAVALLRCCARKYVGNPTDFETFFF
ncbi:Protein CBG16068 [Caenorhabditis briggsae]|uniref:Protein CBG16068 n=1 Tax=Caenorhabditis briggsae TaxID=6238 RepID=A8XN62_CAEBR|nr:Protein CBG16068 [Caenorhabditis briggsae]CAP34292.2 Protein CBG16068 [Caenorhabditis briggsae]